MTIPQALQLISQHYQAGELAKADQLCMQVLQADASQSQVWAMRGLLALHAGQPELSLQFLDHALRLTPADATSHSHRAVALMSLNRLEESVAAFERSTQLAPADSSTLNNLGVALHRLRRYADSAKICREAIALSPTSVEAHNNLGLSLYEMGQPKEAANSFRQALSIQPNHGAALANLALTLARIGQLDESIDTCRRVIQLDPNNANAYNILGNALRLSAQITDSLDAFRQASTILPDWIVPRTNLLFTLLFDPRANAADLLHAHRQFDADIARRFYSQNRVFPNISDPARRLRIGYSGAHFFDHCQSFFTLPLFSNHNRDQFEIFCYSNVVSPDAISERHRGMVDHWRNTAQLTDEQLADQIRNDQVDILIDLTMHMEGSRSLCFARKPAPIQIAWLAYPGTTGLSAMDYRLTDPHLDPPGEHDLDYSERSIRLPDSFWCYDPLTSDPPVNPLPALEAGFVTFGCLNSFSKVNSDVLSLWRELFAAIPSARLLLLAPPGRCRQRCLDEMRIDPNRVTFVDTQSRPDYLKTYHRIDLCLDAVPYNGHTTTLDALWMGVPTVTLLSQRVVGRAGLSATRNVGLSEFVAETSSQYIDIAIRASSDLSRLADLRAGLRHRMEQSPLMDGKRFARNMEDIYRRVWMDWCATKRD